MDIMNRQAIIASLIPGVLFIIVSIVAAFLDLGLGEVIFQFGALITVLGGGAVAWNNVYSKKSVDQIKQETGQWGLNEGKRQQEAAHQAYELEHAEMWEQAENLAGTQTPDPKSY